MSICITKKRPTITWSSPLFQHIIHLNIEIPSCSPIWSSLLNISKNNTFSFISLIKEDCFSYIEINLIYLLFSVFISVSTNQTNDDDDNNDNSQKSVTCLSQFVYLPNVIRVEFGSAFDVSHWRDIQLILQYV
jgi:hypothetical protein